MSAAPPSSRGPGALRLLLRLLASSARSQAQYRLSFLLVAAGQFMIFGAEFMAMAGLFERFGQIHGWRLREVALLFGMAHTSLALANMPARGFDRFGELLKAGEFDRVLLRPRPVTLLLAGHEVVLRRLGRLALGLLVMAAALAGLEVAWTPAKLVLLPAAILGGSCLFYGIFVLQATMAFWTTESLEVMNVMTYGGVEAVQYPVSIYDGLLRELLLYVIPLACINYLPALALLERADPLGLPVAARWLAPLAGPLFLAVCVQVFERAVGRYQSTGS